MVPGQPPNCPLISRRQEPASSLPLPIFKMVTMSDERGDDDDGDGSGGEDDGGGDPPFPFLSSRW